MVSAYVFISTNREPSLVAQELTELDKIESTHLLYGEYDIVTKVKAKDMIRLRNFAIHELPKVQGIQKSTTLIVADEE